MLAKQRARSEGRGARKAKNMVGRTMNSGTRPSALNPYLLHHLFDFAAGVDFDLAFVFKAADDIDNFLLLGFDG
jgi:hypothetical protein